jgi:DNA-directed RNA polymerase subunit RPC12/RpoP
MGQKIPSQSDIQSAVDRYSKRGQVGAQFNLLLVPPGERHYKCPTCHVTFPYPKELKCPDEIKCPNCGETKVTIMCPLDHNHCSHSVITTIAYCPLCGQAKCPECGSHDVVQISRVTGYLQDVSGWNAGKQQELKDRVRVKDGELAEAGRT